MGLSLCAKAAKAIAEALFANAVVRYDGGKEKTASVTGGATSTINLAAGNTQVLTLTADTVLTLSGATAGTSCSISLHVVQDATGGWDITWPAGVKWAGGSPPTLTATANAHDLAVLETLDGGTTWFGTFAADFS